MLAEHRPGVMDPSLPDMLSLLCDEQREDPEYTDIPVPVNAGRRALFAAYKQTSLFHHALEEAAGWFSLGLNFGEHKEILRRFGGRVFADLAYIQVACDMGSSGVILSERRTLELYRLMFPDRRLEESPFSSSISGVSVPDILEVQRDPHDRRTKVTVAFDFTLHREKDFQILDARYRADRSAFPDLFSPEACTVFVVPSDQITPKHTGSLYFYRMPFTAEQIHDFRRSLYTIYRRNPQAPTLAEIAGVQTPHGATQGVVFSRG